MKRKIHLLGIVNLTPDSYYAASRTEGTDALLRRVGTMLEEGADAVDLGACSTRPGSAPVGAEEEWRRLEPALKAVRSTFPQARISIDTYWSVVVERAFGIVGPFLVNDVGGGVRDPEMLSTVGRLGLPYVAMCPSCATVEEILAWFKAFSPKAEEAGIRDHVIIMTNDTDVQSWADAHGVTWMQEYYAEW